MLSARRRHILLLLAVVGVSVRAQAHGDVQVFVNRYLDWLAASQFQVRSIDFETLPNGAPSQAGVPITASFNYTNQGVTFSGPPYPVTIFAIAGNPTSRYSLSTAMLDPPFRTWISADLVTPSPSAGIFFSGGTTATIFDRHGSLLASETFVSVGGGHFIGFVSTTPIALMTIDRGSSVESIESFVFSPIPEPAVLGLVLCGGALVFRRRRRRRPG